jgi:hypothetical protein
MKYLLALLLLLIATPLQSATHQQVGSGLREANPCGATLLELDSLTEYWERAWAAEYKDFTSAEVAHFLEKNKIGRSDVTGVRVFRSDQHKDYAVVAYFLFESTLDGEPLVSVNCVLTLNNAPGMIFLPESFQELMGETYEEIGQ